MPVGYPVDSAFLRRCGSELCQITVRIPVEGETQLQDALADLYRTWTHRFGDVVPVPGTDTDPGCASEILVGRYSCLLRGEGRFVATWDLTTAPPDPGDRMRDGRAQVTAFGAAGTQRATIRVTLATAAGIARARERDL